jgi:DNA polymerase III alpha subunit (gram-positive type)
MGKRIEIKLDFEDSTKTTGKYLVFDIETTGLQLIDMLPLTTLKIGLMLSKSHGFCLTMSTNLLSLVISI